MSTGGASLKDMDDFVTFFTNRNIPISINHCVSIYPSEDRELELNQIDFLKNRCGYTEVIQEGLGSLNIFLEDKTNIDSYLSLFKFINLNYSKLAQENFGLIPIGKVVDDLKRKSNYQEDEFKSFLMQLKYTNRIVLKTTKSQLAKSRNLELMDIHGIRYGFLKLIDSTTPEV